VGERAAAARDALVIGGEPERYILEADGEKKGKEINLNKQGCRPKVSALDLAVGFVGRVVQG